MGFMMKIFFVLLWLVSINISANECDISADTLSAYYQLSHQASKGEQRKLPEPQLFQLHRDNYRVLQRNVSKGINDIWSQYGGRLSLTRAFDEYQHAIEYQPNELCIESKSLKRHVEQYTNEIKNSLQVIQKKESALTEYLAEQKKSL